MPKDPAKTIKHLTGKAVSQYKMINEGDKILVAISGGKDSIAMAHILFELQKRAPVKFELLVASIDPGFTPLKIKELGPYFEKNRWPYAFNDINTQEILKEKNAEKNPCALCSRLRRGKLHNLADKHGCNKIALGHHLDDICVSLLLSFFRGQGITTMGPNVAGDNNSKRIIRPFAFVEESLIKQYVKTIEMPDIGACTHEERVKNSGDRAFLSKAIIDFEKKFQNIRRNMLNSLQNAQPEHLMDSRFLEL